MTSQQIKDDIQQCSLEPTKETVNKLLSICDMLNLRIDNLERDLHNARATARRASNVADCLANGIQPD